MNDGKNVLVVDDDRHVLNSLATVVSSLGHGVTTATTGTTALAKAKDRKLDLVLLDLRLPDIGGVGVLNGLLAQQPGLPILIVTGDWDGDDKEQLRRAVAVVEKPIEVALLLRLVTGILRGAAPSA
jgi:DNA-binding response OmpR family regulator